MKSKEIAKRMMLAIQVNEGLVNKYSEAVFEEEWVNKIAIVAEPFFKEHSDLIREETIVSLAIGGLDWLKRRYNKVIDWEDLNNTLNEYYLHLIGCKNISVEDLMESLPGVVMDGRMPYFLAIVKDCDLETGEDLWVVKYSNDDSIIYVTRTNLRVALKDTLRELKSKGFKHRSETCP